MLWAVELDNFHGQNFTYIFDNYGSAHDTFVKVCLANKDKDEFEMDEYEGSWFDEEYNEYSTCVFLYEKKVFSEPIEPEEL